MIEVEALLNKVAGLEGVLLLVRVVVDGHDLAVAEGSLRAALDGLVPLRLMLALEDLQNQTKVNFSR